MSDKPLAEALSKPIVIPDPEDGLTVAVEANEDDVGATVSYDHDIGKPGGWSLGTEGGWWKSTGGVIKGWVKWRPKQK